MATTDALQQQIEGLYSDHHQASDLVHDTFMRLLAREEALSLQEPRAFLTTVAQRVLANHWRRQQVERAYLDALALVPETREPSEEERAILLETLIEIDRLLDGLSIPVRRAFLMTQLDGMNHAQVAEALGISITSVKRYLVKAARHCYFSDVVFPC